MDKKVQLVVIEGSARDNRQSIKAARYVADIGRTLPDVEITFVDPKDFTFPNDGNGSEGKDPKYTEIIAKADGFFIVTPEYNHSYPGTLKRMLDSEYKNYFKKPVVLAGVSDGDWGGTRCIEALLPVLRSLGLLVGQSTSYFPCIQDIFDEQGVINEAFAAKYDKSIRYQYQELLWLANVLRQGRQAS